MFLQSAVVDAFPVHRVSYNDRWAWLGWCQCVVFIFLSRVVFILIQVEMLIALPKHYWELLNP